MGSANVDVVRGIFEAWARQEPPHALAALIDPDIEVHPDPRSAWPGIEPTYLGYDGINRYLGSIYASFEDYHADPEQLLDAGDRVVVLAIERGRGRHSGAEVEIRHTAHIWTLRDGKAVRLDVNWDRQHTLDDAGLSRT
jgi:ketosteroid isomerase-like protein